jgi:xylan 1,4-beta-xylosidase
MLRTPESHWYSRKGTSLRIQARAESLSGSGNPSFLALRQSERQGVFTLTLAYAPSRNGDNAGLAAFADEAHFMIFGLRQVGSTRVLSVYQRNGIHDPAQGKSIKEVRLPATTHTLRLKLRINDPDYAFEYALPHGTNQFTGVVIGAYAERAAMPIAPKKD